MAKRKHKSIDSEKESVEDKVLKRYHKYKKIKESEADEEDDTSGVLEEQQADPVIDESDANEAEKIFKKVKKIKDKNTKLSKKLKKSAKVAAKEQSEQNTTLNSDDKSENQNRSEVAINYLNDWKYKRDEWKFKKTLQIWLLKNWSNINKISDKDFDLFAEYVLGLHPNSSARTRLESEAKQVIDQEKESEEVIERARRLVQCFV